MRQIERKFKEKLPISFIHALLFSHYIVSDSFETPWTVSLVHEISQTRILEWVAVSSSRGSSRPRDWTHISCIAGGFFTAEPSGKECISHEHLKISYVFTTEYMQFYFFCFQLLFLSTAIFWIMEGLLFLFSHFTITLRNQMHRMCTVLSHSVVSDSLQPHGL